MNNDSFINVTDIVLMVNLVVGSNNNLDEYLCASDFNQDNIINVQDIVLLVTLILS